uniref:Neural cell adhesion molecule 2 n=1 Tax=Tetraodon nigroviridis TaxID=99883 RepID=H3BWQ8_TETNG
ILHIFDTEQVLFSLSIAGTLQVSISLNKVELSVGESKFFICTGTSIGEPVRLEWYNPQGERIVSSKRMALHTESSRSKLIIYNAIIEDAGIYRCQATDADGHTEEASVVLEIYQRLTFRDVQSPQEFRHGETAEVVCDVISSPVPLVVWYYQDREITEEHHSRFLVLANNNLQIQQVTKADEGVYRCEASVEARGEIDFVDIAVVVNVPPVLSVFQQSFNATADYQESVTFTCITSGSPDPVVTWLRKGQRLEPSDKYMFNRMEGGRSMLTIRNIRQSDGGSYTCNADNKAGTQERELFLKVFVAPHITQLKNVTAVEGSVAMISCMADGEPLPDVSWRRASDSLSLHPQSHDVRFDVRGRHGKSVLTISGIRLSDLGRFDCEALSRIGGHQKSMFLDIEHIPKFLTNHTIYYSWEGNPVNISCDVMSNPPATMLWRRERFTISAEGAANIRVHTAEGKSVLEVTPMSDRDFGRYNCTARNNIGMRYQEFILAQADVPSNPYSVRLSAVSQRLATVTFMKPDSHGGVPISYYLVQYKEFGLQDWRDVKSHSVQTTVVLTGLEPNTTYEVRVAAVNGKGQGEFSHTEAFQTLPIREPSPPAVHGQRGMGKAYRLGLVKQDDGGMPIVEYIVKYKTDKEEQWMTKLVPGANDFAILQPLQWNTRYEVEITARNVKGLSEPTFYQFFMPQEPDITDNADLSLCSGANFFLMLQTQSFLMQSLC